MVPKVRVVSTKHGYRETHLAKRGLLGHVDRNPYWLLAKVAEHGIDRSFAVSHGLRELYVKSGICDPKRIDVIHHGLPESGVEDDTASRYAAHQVIVPGRLVECKGHIHLLQAFPEVLARHPDAVLVVVGDGPEREALQSLSKELEIEDAVRFVGWQNNVVAWISKSVGSVERARNEYSHESSRSKTGMPYRTAAALGRSRASDGDIGSDCERSCTYLAVGNSSFGEEVPQAAVRRIAAK
jgi:glycosyltransferase involved in cell wall biosynthesis